MKPVILFEANSKNSLTLLLYWSQSYAFSLLNLSDIQNVPQYCSYGSAGVPVVPTIIFMSEPKQRRLTSTTHRINLFWSVQECLWIRNALHPWPGKQNRINPINTISGNLHTSHFLFLSCLSAFLDQLLSSIIQNKWGERSKPLKSIGLFEIWYWNFKRGANIAQILF